MSNLKHFIKDCLIPPKILEVFLSGKVYLKNTLMNSENKRLLADNHLLKNRHTGCRCFILGAGSSIKNQDIKKLKGEFVISVSNTFVHPDFAEINPKYHILPSLIESHGDTYPEEKFIAWLKAMEASTNNAEMFFHIGDRAMIQKNGLFHNRILHWFTHAHWNGNFNTPINLARIPHVWSVSELALTVALYLGFDKIYLIGIDHDWFNGLFVYFFDHKKEHVIQPDKNNLGNIDSEYQMRRHADIFRKYKYLYSIKRNIFNANSNSNHYLDVFPKVDFDSLFESHITKTKKT